MADAEEERSCTKFCLKLKKTATVSHLMQKQAFRTKYEELCGAVLKRKENYSRLRTQNQELQEKADQVKEQFRQLEEDRSDIIAHLKRDVEEKIEESKVLSEQLSALEEIRKEDLASFKKKEEAMDIEYRTMENNLSAEVKLAAGKLNALEDWRLARLDLMQKFENQEKEIAEQEKRHTSVLYEAEKSVVIGKARMKEEMEKRLMTLAETLCTATNLRVADATQRVVRENMALNQESDKMLQTCRELETTNKECKETERISRLQCELFETQAKISLNKEMEQRRAIHKIVEDFQSMMSYYGKIERTNMRMAQYEKIAEDSKQKNQQMEQKIRFLEKCVLKVRNDREQLLSQVREREEELCVLGRIVNSARSCIKEALQLTIETQDENYCTMHLKNKLLHSLWEILDNDNITSALKYTASQMEDIPCLYTEGCLCFVEPPETNKAEQAGTKKGEENNTQEYTEEKNTQEYTEEKNSQEYTEEKNTQEYTEEKNTQEYTEEITTPESVQERPPSCVSSDISFNIPSPKESVTDSEP